MMNTRKPSPGAARWALIRDIVLFSAGLAGVAHETLLANLHERPTLLLLFATMMGLPAFLRADSRSSKDDPPPPREKEIPK